MTDEYYHPSRLSYSVKQWKWLIPLLPELRIGHYPGDSQETGYEDNRITGKGGKKKSPFETAICIATELDTRLEKAGIAGLIIEMKYSHEHSNDIYMDQHLAKMLDISVGRVRYLTAWGFKYIRGKNQKRSTFDQYRLHQKATEKEGER